MSKSLPFALLLLVLALLSGPPHLGFVSTGWWAVKSDSVEIQESQEIQEVQEVQQIPEIQEIQEIPEIPEIPKTQEKGNTRKRSRYGQNCSETLKCKSASWLSCQNSTCQCFRPNEMKYDEATRKCVSQIGERCRFGINQDSKSGSGSRIIYEVTGCGPNAYCNSDGICVCFSTFFENSNGDCTPKLGHLESCNSESDIECFDCKGLSCQTEKCRCEDLKSVYSESENQCVGLGGQPCINSKCSQHANCSIENICQCQNNFYQNSDDGVCLPEIALLQNCTEDFQCLRNSSQPLVCLDGICNCNPAKSVYAIARVSVHLDGTRVRACNEFQGFEGPELTGCAGLVGSECVDRLCVPNAFCSYSVPFFRGTTTTSTTTTQRPERRRMSWFEDSEDNTEYKKSLNHADDVQGYYIPLRNMEKESKEINHSGTCKCTPGYTKTKLNRCAVPFNSGCDFTSDCTDGLICRNLKCTCPYNIQNYDKVKATCVSQIGGPCDPSPNHPDLSCGENAFCKAINSTSKNQGQTKAGHCVCQNGLVDTAGGNCVTGYGGACRVTTDCDSIAQLDCIDQRCACPAFEEYNASVRKCVGLVGANCNSGLENECTDNAQCAPGYQKQLPGTCACNMGFEENEKYTCDPLEGIMIVAD